MIFEEKYFSRYQALTSLTEVGNVLTLLFPLHPYFLNWALSKIITWFRNKVPLNLFEKR